MSICYKPYVSSHKKCKKTIIIEKVTCAFCQNKLRRDGKVEIVLRKKKE